MLSKEQSAALIRSAQCPLSVLQSRSRWRERAGRSAIWVIISIALLGCSNKNEGSAVPTNSQIIARVGDQVVSAQELDTELRWNNASVGRNRDDVAVKRALGELVTRKYLLQRSLAAKLDREPTVLLDVLRSREQVLARAYAMRELSKQASAISMADIEKYIVDHPLKFAKRNMIAIDQISFPVGSIDQSVTDSLKALSSLEEVEKRLTGLGIAHAKSSATLNTSEISDELLSSIQEKKPGEVVFVRSLQNSVFLTVKGEALRPLEGDAAITLARQLQQQDLAKAQASLMNFTASMEAKYEGEYAKIMGDHPTLPSVTN